MTMDLFETTDSKNSNKEKPIADKKTSDKPTAVYSPEQITASCLEYFKGDALASDVWMNKYALRDGEKIYELNPNDSTIA